MDPDYLSPPPAYSERESDQKLQAMNVSVIASATQDQDGWERYDPAVFEAAPTSVVNHSSKRNFFDEEGRLAEDNLTRALPTIVPSRIDNKSQSRQNDPFGVLGDRSDDKFALHPAVCRSSRDDRRDTRSNANSYLHEGYVLQQTAAPLYSGGPIPQSRSFLPAPASKTGSPWNRSDQSQRSPSDSYWSPSQRGSSRHPVPPAPAKQSVLQEQGVKSLHPSDVVRLPSTPMVPFDPSIAYGNVGSNPSENLTSPGLSAARVQYDPHSLYNPAISPQMLLSRSLDGFGHQTPLDEQLHSTLENAPSRSVYQTRLFNNDPSLGFSHPNVANIPRQSVGRQSAARPTSRYPTPNSSHNLATAADTNPSHYSNT